MTFNYFESVKEDIKNALETEHDIPSIKAAYSEDPGEVYDDLYEEFWIDDNVTGNGSGTYAATNEEARGYVMADPETVIEALQEFCTPAEEIGKKFIENDFHYLDVSTRCYVLGIALTEVLDTL